ncbi:MAG TPA: c-type cytochrome biogenesis protein CcsB [Mycobacteriales bacterium]|nr:c-type cytochrome biogenesis protein CcsB [Mycobacteriales bacterium]
MTDAAWADLSDATVTVAVLLYAVAMLALAGEQAARASARTGSRASRRAAAEAARRATAERTRVMAGVGGPSLPETASPPAGAPERARASRAGRLGMALALLGLAVHTVSVVTRGLAVDRVPWGNMYEFSSAAALSAVAIFVVLVARRVVDRGLGAFVLLPVVLTLGLASSVLYTPAGPLVPALNSYWIKIHVAAAVLCTGAFLLSGVVAGLYLLRDSADSRLAAGSPLRFPLSLGPSLPTARSLDRAAYAVIAFAFPLWTFAIIAGAIWAEAAWGRYWGWDPKETWSFITWVLYAGYLHARATAGWRGTRAAWIAVAAAVALTINYYVVNIFVVGLHSYA